MPKKSGTKKTIVKVKELEPKIKILDEIKNEEEDSDETLNESFSFMSPMSSASIDTTLSRVEGVPTSSQPPTSVVREEESENQSVRYNVQQARTQTRRYQTSSGRQSSDSTLPESQTSLNTRRIDSQEFNHFQQQNRLNADRNNLINPNDILDDSENERKYDLNDSSIRKRRSDSQFF
jgi:hypothetical protein